MDSSNTSISTEEIIEELGNNLKEISLKIKEPVKIAEYQFASVENGVVININKGDDTQSKKELARMLVMEMNSNDIMKLLEEKAEKNEESFY
jgi:hypothetical protein